MQITADGCERKNFSSRQEMKKRFFFNGVNMNRAGVSVYYGSQYAVDINSNATLTALAGLN
jgi:hypothetical protein